MKKVFYFALLSILISACSNQQKELTTPYLPSSSESDIYTKAAINDDYLVTEQDLDAYTHYLAVHDSYKDNPVHSIEPYEIGGKNLFYIINLKEGWQILSSDKRGPIILAQSKEGQFDQELSNEEEQAWFETIAGQIAYRNEHPDNYYKDLSQEGVENENKCLDFWKAINADPTFLEAHLNNKQLLSSGERLTPTRMYTVEVLYDSVDHLIPVYWSQGDPFNLYCPLKSESSTQRCPAGCGPLAVAQTVYYLHYNIVHRPSNSPSSGSCIGWVDNYTQTFSNFTNTTWGNMAYSNDPYGYAALLIGYVGKEMHTTYGANSSSTSASRISSIFGSSFGIHYQTGTYDEDTVFSNIQSGLPVICIAWSSSSGHAFILDGYNSYVTETHYEYTLPSGNVVESITLSDPYLKEFRINWGWGSIGRTATYSASGSWLGYDSNRLIVYDFMSESK